MAYRWRGRLRSAQHPDSASVAGDETVDMHCLDRISTRMEGVNLTFGHLGQGLVCEGSSSLRFANHCGEFESASSQ